MMRLVSMTVAALALGAGLSAMAQEDSGFVGPVVPAVAAPGEPPDTYGTGSLAVYSVSSVNFIPRTSSVPYGTLSGIERFLPTGGSLEASPNLPNGAQIERIELRACDTSATEQVVLNVGSCPTPGLACSQGGSVGTGTAAAPGCGYFQATLATPLVVNNQATPIILDVSTGLTSSTTFSAATLYYRLRVSPAPSTATFPNDVPTTHPFFRFVEALAAAGITGGCGSGSYCPDEPVTRGQMAVFLSSALGLHFPN